MATGIIVIVVAIASTFIYFWMESNYTEIWKRIIETVANSILSWGLVALFFAAVFAVVNYISQ